MSGSITNWAGNIAFRARRVHRPSSVGELQDVVSRLRRVRVLGTGHSFNRIADSADDLVSVAGLPATIDIDAERGTVTVAAGVRYGELAARLHAAGYALPNLASLPHISVAGSCATATHGSGNRNGNLATAVSAMQLVTADGELRTVSRQADGERFDAMVVALGALGVVTSLTLDLVPTFDIRQYVYEDLPREQLDEHWPEIFGSGYSVSVFTDWTGPGLRQVWVKRDSREQDTWAPQQPRWGARPADGPRHPVPGMSPVHCTGQLGVAGAWHTRLPHFRLEFTPSNGEELQSEYVLPRERIVEALAAMDRIRDRVAPVLQICEIRTVAADQQWLSPNYHRDSVNLHFTWVADTEAVVPVLGAVEEQLAPLAPRPHWGKLFTSSPAAVGASYERLPDFQRLLGEYDPAGKFRNEFVDRYLPPPRG